MENATAVGKNALKYRLVIKETLGLTISLALTVIVAIAIYFIKVRYAILIDIGLFVGVFILQFVVIYFVSVMQFKNLKYSIGQNSVSFQRGTFGVDRETIPFEKIKNSTFDQSFIQRMFSVGDITIDLDDEKYIWDSIDANTATLITKAVSAKGDVQPITVRAATAAVNQTQPQSPIPPIQSTQPTQPPPQPPANTN